MKDHIISVNKFTFNFDSYYYIEEDYDLEVEQETIDMYRYMNNYIQKAGK